MLGLSLGLVVSGLKSCCLGFEGAGLGTCDLVYTLPVTILHLQVVVTNQKLHSSCFFSISSINISTTSTNEWQTNNVSINNVFLNTYPSAQLVSRKLDFYRQEANVLVRNVSELNYVQCSCVPPSPMILAMVMKLYNSNNTLHIHCVPKKWR